MTDRDPTLDDDEPQLDENDPGELGTSFATKGMGWSRREGEDEDDGGI